MNDPEYIWAVICPEDDNGIVAGFVNGASLPLVWRNEKRAGRFLKQANTISKIIGKQKSLKLAKFKLESLEDINPKEEMEK